MRSEQGSDCSNLYLMKINSLDPKNILLRDQRVVKMHRFFTRKIMMGSNFSLVIHIPQGMEVSKSTVVLQIDAKEIDYQCIGISRKSQLMVKRIISGI